MIYFFLFFLLQMVFCTNDASSTTSGHSKMAPTVTSPSTVEKNIHISSKCNTCFAPNTSVNCCAAGCQKCFGGGFEPWPPYANCRGKECGDGCPGGLCPCANCTCCYTNRSTITTTASLSLDVVTIVTIIQEATVTTTLQSPVFETFIVTFTQISKVLFSSISYSTETASTTSTIQTTFTSSIIITSTVYLDTTATIFPIPITSTTITTSVNPLAFTPTSILAAIDYESTGIRISSTPLFTRIIPFDYTYSFTTPSPSVIFTITHRTDATSHILRFATSITLPQPSTTTTQSYIVYSTSLNISTISVELVSPLSTTTLYPIPPTTTTTTLPTVITSTTTLTASTTTI